MKVFYNDYYEDERLYSTGDYELDDLMEDAFCDGYEYAARLFAETAVVPVEEAKKEGAKKEKGPNIFQKSGKWIKNTWRGEGESADKAIQRIMEKSKKKGKNMTEEQARKIVKGWNRAGMIGIPAAVVAAGTTAGIVGHNRRKKRRQQEAEAQQYYDE